MQRLGAEGTLLIRMSIAFLTALASCAAHRSEGAQGNAHPATQGIMYASHDPSQFILFSADGARFGPMLSFLPQHPPDATRYFQPAEGVQCVSMGVPGNTEDYAIKRPIRAGDRYQCLTTSFRVVRCFEVCRAAVIQREVRSADSGPRTSSFYVWNCQGIIAFSDSADMTQGIPFDALLLLGNVGILADPAYPAC
jgi:hypothetical protein